ncbi:hypothetical protein SAMN05216217_11249 [Halopseudomonas yangmingensis]|uniref:VanZ like family protein n=1 Tax=Halopseudomonas yangmingensis TaxID=1720063 RepID=A0A1I4T0I6_9GAMM|nr:hypothetical protein SAMN05216217_11249 [Halopseudomonas yangmingensis]
MTLRRALFLGCLSMFLYGMFRPAGPPGSLAPWDKELHFLAFAALTFTGRLAYPRVRWFFFWPLMLALAPFSEWLQDRLHRTRVFDTGDIIANLLGVFAGAVLLTAWWLLLRRVRRASARGSEE